MTEKHGECFALIRRRIGRWCGGGVPRLLPPFLMRWTTDRPGRDARCARNLAKNNEAECLRLRGEAEIWLRTSNWPSADLLCRFVRAVLAGCRRQQGRRQRVVHLKKIFYAIFHNETMFRGFLRRDCGCLILSVHCGQQVSFC